MTNERNRPDYSQGALHNLEAQLQRISGPSHPAPLAVQPVTLLEDRRFNKRQLKGAKPRLIDEFIIAAAVKGKK